GTNITPNYDAKYDHVSANINPKVAASICRYTEPGLYTAKVIIERGSSTAEARTTIEVLENTNVSPTPTSTVSATTEKRDFTFRQGYNIFGLPDASASPKTFSQKALTTFAYNIANRKNWIQWPADESLFTMMPGKGYYIYNPSAETTVKVPVMLKSDERRIYPGWNLLWTGTDASLSDMTATVSDSSPKSLLNQGNNKCIVHGVTLQDLVSKGLAYKYTYVIADDSATTVCKAFKILSDHDSEPAAKCDGSISTLGTVSKVPAGKGFWFYISPNKIDSVGESFPDENKC
ncbi:hypothetical protein COT77_03690, partial [Candidatus Berkelbacteria bacterium CG10_big_fil_rev_8_21_14_0_10_41_12]